MQHVLSLIRGFAIAGAALSANAATTYDLKSQWSKTANPNGPWTVSQGASALPRDKDWTAISNADSAYNPARGHIRQPSFAPGNHPGHFLPAWFKAAVTPNDPAYGWSKGDLILHTTDEFNGIGSGLAGVTFTAPAGGSARLSGYLYNARNMGRPQAWTLAFDGVVIAEGSLPGDGTFTHDHKQEFDVTGVPLSAGDAVDLTIYEDGGPSGPGDFVGLDLKVTID